MVLPGLPYLKLKKLEYKLLLFFILVSALPLIGSSIFWFQSSKSQALVTTSQNLKSSASDAAHLIEGFINTEEQSLLIHSQTQSILGNDIPQATIELQNFLLQDNNIQELTLIGPDGKELIHVNRSKVFGPGELQDQSQSPAFKVPTYVGGENYVGKMNINSEGSPTIYISLPIIKPGTKPPTRSRKPGEILGVLKADYLLTDLWSQLSKIKIGQSGYVFLVDQNGNVIFHPHQELAKQQKNLRGLPIINQFEKAGGIPPEGITQVKNEFGVNTLVSFALVKPTGWGAITEIHTSDTLLTTNQVTLFIVFLFLIFLVFVVILSLWLSSTIVGPIEVLQEGTNILGSGNLKYRLDIKTGDEIEKMSNSFNQMATNLQDAFDKLEKDAGIIAAERNKLMVLVSAITDAVVAVDTNRGIIIFNKAAEKITGSGAGEMIGRKIDNVLRIYDADQELTPEQYCPIKENSFEGVVFQKENLKIKTNDKEIYANITSEKIKEGASVNLGCILTIHDVSEEKQLEEMKLDFVSMAVHELRTPLTSVIGYLSVFIGENKHKLTEEQNKFLNRIKISTERLITLVENLLSASKIEKGAFTLTTEKTDWVELAKKHVVELADQAKDKNIGLTFHDPGQKLYAIVDNLRIGEVITNLLANAIAYTNPGGQIDVWFEADDKQITTHVKDTGGGIPPDALPHLFTKFFRVTNSLRHKSKGTGLGLFITKNIVEMHNGKIWVKSQPGEGSVFSFSLPRAYA